jgi:hypothetical protein
MKEFGPVNEDQRQEFEVAKHEAFNLTSELRNNPKGANVSLLKQFDNHFVKCIYEFALQNEDYEVCEAAKEVLEERRLIYKG